MNLSNFSNVYYCTNTDADCKKSSYINSYNITILDNHEKDVNLIRSSIIKSSIFNYFIITIDNRYDCIICNENVGNVYTAAKCILSLDIINLKDADTKSLLSAQSNPANWYVLFEHYKKSNEKNTNTSNIIFMNLLLKSKNIVLKDTIEDNKINVTINRNECKNKVEYFHTIFTSIMNTFNIDTNHLLFKIVFTSSVYAQTQFNTNNRNYFAFIIALNKLNLGLDIGAIILNYINDYEYDPAHNSDNFNNIWNFTRISSLNMTQEFAATLLAVAITSSSLMAKPVGLDIDKDGLYKFPNHIEIKYKDIKSLRLNNVNDSSCYSAMYIYCYTQIYNLRSIILNNNKHIALLDFKQLFVEISDNRLEFFNIFKQNIAPMYSYIIYSNNEKMITAAAKYAFNNDNGQSFNSQATAYDKLYSSFKTAYGFSLAYLFIKETNLNFFIHDAAEPAYLLRNNYFYIGIAKKSVELFFKTYIMETYKMYRKNNKQNFEDFIIDMLMVPDTQNGYSCICKFINNKLSINLSNLNDDDRNEYFANEVGPYETIIYIMTVLELCDPDNLKSFTREQTFRLLHYYSHIQKDNYKQHSLSINDNLNKYNPYCADLSEHKIAVLNQLLANILPTMYSQLTDLEKRAIFDITIKAYVSNSRDYDEDNDNSNNLTSLDSYNDLLFRQHKNYPYDFYSLINKAVVHCDSELYLSNIITLALFHISYNFLKINVNIEENLELYALECKKIFIALYKSNKMYKKIWKSIISKNIYNITIYEYDTLSKSCNDTVYLLYSTLIHSYINTEDKITYIQNFVNSNNYNKTFNSNYEYSKMMKDVAKRLLADTTISSDIQTILLEHVLSD